MKWEGSALRREWKHHTGEKEGLKAEGCATIFTCRRINLVDFLVFFFLIVCVLGGGGARGAENT